jgi:hypothetical protein
MADREELEKKKLQVEVDEIEQRIESERKRIEAENKSTTWERAKILATIGLTFISITIGIVTIWTKSATFLEQREKEQGFRLNKEMLDLVDQLNADKDYEQENAAILLSYFKKDAIPILLMNLRRTNRPEATIDSLKLIKGNKKVKPNEVLDPLIKSAKKVFSSKDVKSDKAIIAFRNYIMALGDLGKEKEKDVTGLLENLKKQVEGKKLDVTDPAVDVITQEIDRSLKKLQENSITHSPQE